MVKALGGGLTIGLSLTGIKSFSNRSASKMAKEHPGLRGTPLAMLAAQCNKLSSMSPPPLADAAVGKGFHPWKKSGGGSPEASGSSNRQQPATTTTAASF